MYGDLRAPYWILRDMRIVGNQFQYSPTDLSRYQKSAFASTMEWLSLQDPAWRDKKDEPDPLLETLQQKGYAHEDALESELRRDGRSVVVINSRDSDIGFRDTQAAMNDGTDVIVQARLALDKFAGLADFLVRIDGESSLGSWHYEVWDTKLARRANPSFILQLCCYAEMLEGMQERLPESVAVVLGNGKRECFQVRDYYAYYQQLKSDFIEQQAKLSNSNASVPPDPWHSSSHGDWSTLAAQLLEQQDHLCRVANASRTQVDCLLDAGIETLSALAESSLTTVPGVKPPRFSRLRQQASLQQQSASSASVQYEVIAHNDAFAQGLQLLPPESSGDIFFDIEGYPFDENGLEYLWGITYFDEKRTLCFKDIWAHDTAQEKLAFETFIHWVYERWQHYPDMHIYHYANYEVAACRRLMGVYGTCEKEVDDLLRNEVFVDLYKVVKGGLLVGEPRYSIKNIEKLYRDSRSTDVSSGGESIVVYDSWRTAWLAGEDSDNWKTSEALGNIRAYNKDDCDSTHELVVWLREVQVEAGIEWPGLTATSENGTSSQNNDQTQTDTEALRDQLLARSESIADTDKELATAYETIAWSMEFHRRENKPGWWRYFDRLSLSHEELVDDPDCLGDCIRTAREPFKLTPRSRNLVYEYKFDPGQEFKGKSKEFRVPVFIGCVKNLR